MRLLADVEMEEEDAGEGTSLGTCQQYLDRIATSIGGDHPFAHNILEPASTYFPEEGWKNYMVLWL